MFSVGFCCPFRVSEIGCPGARDIRLTAADKYLPHVTLDILERHETTKYTPNDFIKDLLVISIDICIPEVKRITYQKPGSMQCAINRKACQSNKSRVLSP
jgi:hypothetical protein